MHLLFFHGGEILTFYLIGCAVIALVLLALFVWLIQRFIKTKKSAGGSNLG